MLLRCEARSAGEAEEKRQAQRMELLCVQERLERLEKLLRQRTQALLLCEAVSTETACNCSDNSYGYRNHYCFIGKMYGLSASVWLLVWDFTMKDYLV